MLTTVTWPLTTSLRAPSLPSTPARHPGQSDFHAAHDTDASAPVAENVTQPGPQKATVIPLLLGVQQLEILPPPLRRTMAP